MRRCVVIVCLVILYYLVWLWVFWQPSSYTTIPNVKGSICSQGKCWEVVEGRRVRL